MSKKIYFLEKKGQRKPLANVRRHELACTALKLA